MELWQRRISQFQLGKHRFKGKNGGGENKEITKQVDEDNVAKEDGCETFCVAESSQSVSKTLGTEDTTSSSNTIQDGRVPDEKKNKTFASLFKTTEILTHDFSTKFEDQDDEVVIEVEDVDDVIETCGWVSGINAINKMRGTWKLPNKFNIHKSGGWCFALTVRQTDNGSLMEHHT